VSEAREDEAREEEAEEEAAESVEVRTIAAERLTMFVDAVIAIAITLLALDLPVPEGNTNKALLSFVAGPRREEYIAFLISFAVIGAYWTAHHRVFRYVTALGGNLVRLTLLWLLMQVITPFGTRVLTGNGAFQARFIFYALIQVVASTLFILMVRNVRKYRIYRKDTPPRLFYDAVRRSAAPAFGFLLSIPLSFVGQTPAYACWIAVPVVGGILNRIDRRRTPGRAGPE